MCGQRVFYTTPWNWKNLSKFLQVSLPEPTGNRVRWPVGEAQSKKGRDGSGMSSQKRELWSIIKRGDPDALRDHCIKYRQLGCDLALSEMEDRDGFPPLNAVVIHGRNVALIPLLCEFGINVDTLYNFSMLPVDINETPLMQACCWCNVAAVEVLLRLGADRRRQDWRGMDAFAYLQDCKDKLLRQGVGRGFVTQSVAKCDECRALLDAPPPVPPVRPAKKACSFCQVEGAGFKVCGACKQVFYCSVEHSGMNVCVYICMYVCMYVCVYVRMIIACHSYNIQHTTSIMHTLLSYTVISYILHSYSLYLSLTLPLSLSLQDWKRHKKDCVTMRAKKGF
jgi:hypothetical protein